MIEHPFIYLPICNNHDFFLPGQLDKVFTSWRDKGLSLVKDFYYL